MRGCGLRGGQGLVFGAHLVAAAESAAAVCWIRPFSTPSGTGSPGLAQALCPRVARLMFRWYFDGSSKDLGCFREWLLPVDLARSYRGRYRPVMEKIRRALLSVSDKNGLVPLAQTLAAAGV